MLNLNEKKKHLHWHKIPNVTTQNKFLKTDSHNRDFTNFLSKSLKPTTTKNADLSGSN